MESKTQEKERGELEGPAQDSENETHFDNEKTSDFRSTRGFFSLTTKIGGLAALLLGLGAVVTSHFFLSTKALTTELQTVAESGFAVVNALDTLHLFHMREDLALERAQRFSETEPPDSRPNFEASAAAFDSLARQFDAQMEFLLEDLRPNARRRGVSLSLAPIRTELLELNDVHRNFTAEAREFLNILKAAEGPLRPPIERPDIDDYHSEIKSVGRVSLAMTEAAGVRAAKVRSEALRTTAAVTLASLALGVVLSAYVTRRLVSSLKELSAHARRIAFGLRSDQSRFETAPVRSRDEVGQLTKSFNSVVTSLTENIQRRKHLEARLSHDAVHDPLTGLPNRYLFMDRLKRVLADRQNSSDSFPVIAQIDIDRFARINERFGHAVGNSVLEMVARRITSSLRRVDTIARIGGDEFAILMVGVAQIEEAIFLARRLQAEVARPMRVGEHVIRVSISVGVAASSTEYPTADDLMDGADIAAVRARSRGHGSFEICDAAMHRSALDAMELHTDLRVAIDRRQLHVVYQPIVSLNSGGTHEFEALARWNHPNRGLIPPRDFIPVAERTGLIHLLGDFVIGAACDQVRDWRREFDRNDLRVNVNLSPRQLSKSTLVEEVEAALAQSGLDGGNLAVEVTESSLAENPEQADSVLRRLADLGVGIHIDDFGTGYSSMVYLQRFPSDGVKIDRSFVGTMLTQESSFEIVRATISLAHNLKKTSTAEGIETPEQLQALRDLGCDFGQGFLFAKPGAADVVGEFLTSGLPWPSLTAERATSGS